MHEGEGLSMHVHFLGVGGTFMGSLALLTRALGHTVTGSDGPIYPPMSHVLQDSGIQISEGYSADLLSLKPDCFVIGNVMKRGMPIIEALLNQNKPLISGPEWLSQHVLRDKTVLGVAGTHGKTTTTSLLAWILEYAGFKPGFLIGGVPANFEGSARLGGTAPDGESYFVLECDEYDSAFFDKRAKLVHYRPKVTIINNLEFDHADIFANLEAIEQQFHHMVRTLPNEGLVAYPKGHAAIERVLSRGLWTPTTTLGVGGAAGANADADWSYEARATDGSQFTIQHQGRPCGTVAWRLLGEHNQANAVAAVAAAAHIGIKPQHAIEALGEFKGVKRRMEVRHQSPDAIVYDDFAHHPTAIASTLQGLRAKIGDAGFLVAVVDIRSNTMKQGVHQDTLAAAVAAADAVFFFQDVAKVHWDVERMFKMTQKPGGVHQSMASLIAAVQSCVATEARRPAHVLGMSNGAFEAVYAALAIKSSVARVSSSTALL